MEWNKNQCRPPACWYLPCRRRRSSTGQELVGGIEGISRQGVDAAEDIDRDDLPSIPRFDLRPDLALVERVAPRRELLRGIWLGSGCIASWFAIAISF